MSGEREVDLQWLKTVLPKLVRENDEVKGAIITALSNVVSTKDDINRVEHRIENVEIGLHNLDTKVEQKFEQVDKRFEQVDKRFEQVDKRFEQVDKRFEQVDKRFEQVDKRFEQVDKRLDKIENKMDKMEQRINGLSWGNDVKLERFCIQYLKDKENAEYVQLRTFFPDPERIVHKDQKKVEIDLFNEDPLVVAECNLNYNKPGKIQKFAKKCELIENIYKKPAKKYFFVLGVTPVELVEELKSVAAQYNIQLVTGMNLDDY